MFNKFQILDDKINILSKPEDECRYCKLLFLLLKDLEITDINVCKTSNLTSNEYNELITDIKKKTNHNSFPFIFIGKKFIGGYTDFENLVQYDSFSLFDLLSKNNIKYNDEICYL